MFRVGDVVQLRSGGPLMTVVEITAAGGRDTVQCRWFVGSEEKSSSFSAETLKPADLGPKFAYVPGRRR
jgi:uncharacterized protein YodC (DUF2158 family)